MKSFLASRSMFLVALLFIFAGCGSGGSNGAPSAEELLSADLMADPPVGDAPYEVAQAGTCELPVFDIANFDSPIDNPYFPLVPGTTFVYEAETVDELTRNYIYITYDTEFIFGVTCTVVYDVEWVWVEEAGEWFKIEETDDWYAPDNYGNVWYFGEDTVEYLYDDNWDPIGTSSEGSWMAGDQGALPGIIMLADPTPGTCVQQEYYEGEAEDMVKVLRLNAKVSVDYGDFENCLVTKEWTRLEPGNIEHKYYAEDVGLVFIEELKGKTVKVELVDIFAGPPPVNP